MLKRNIVLGDVLVILPFAWILSQALLQMNLIWFFGGLWTFDMYAFFRRNWRGG